MTLGLTDWEYTAREVGEAALAAFVGGLDDTWAGLSLTMPLKQAVIGLLDGVDDVVRATGSCNTVVIDGGRYGHNTDVDGIVAAFAEGGVSSSTRPVILGGGATAASAIAAVRRLGARRATVLVRDLSRAEAASRAGDALGVTCRVGTLDDGGHVESADLVISTLPPGAGDAVAQRLRRVGAGVPLLDVVYEPWPTRLAAAWQGHGGISVAGGSMLLHQAATQVRLMTGREAPIEAMRAGMSAERARRIAQSGDPNPRASDGTSRPDS